jgi:hypothetical protein
LWLCSSGLAGDDTNIFLPSFFKPGDFFPVVLHFWQKTIQRSCLIKINTSTKGRAEKAYRETGKIPGFAPKFIPDSALGGNGRMGN